MSIGKITGLGGVFVKSDDPDMLAGWYGRHLGLPANGAFIEDDSFAVIGFFNRESAYFGQGPQGHMVNFRVDDLDRLLERLRAEGVEVLPDIESHEFGRFAWIVDPDGNRVELWEPNGNLPEETP